MKMRQQEQLQMWKPEQQLQGMKSQQQEQLQMRKPEQWLRVGNDDKTAGGTTPNPETGTTSAKEMEQMWKPKEQGLQRESKI